MAPTSMPALRLNPLLLAVALVPAALAPAMAQTGAGPLLQQQRQDNRPLQPPAPAAGAGSAGAADGGDARRHDGEGGGLPHHRRAVVPGA